MSEFIPPLEMMIEAFRRLPGVGRKSAERMAFGVLDMDENTLNAFVSAITGAKTSIHACPECGNITASELCPICADPARDRSIICVVEDSKGVISFEKIKEFTGVYHVLGGVISPIKSIGPEKLNIKALEERVQNTEVREVILATNPTLEGETTAMYITGILKRYGVKVSRLAYGIPAGGDLEYTDEVTLSRAIEGRQEI